MNLMNIDKNNLPEITLQSSRKEFPIAARRAYLNNASIGPMSLPVLAAIEGFLHDVRDNGRNNYPSWCDYVDGAVKGRIAQFIGADATEIAFVKNTTEGLITVANGLDWRAGDNVVLPDIEYSSNVYCWMRLAKLGVDIRWVKSQGGRVAVDAIAERINSRTRLVSVSAVQFTNGFRQDLAATSQLCYERGILLNVDGIQWIGCLGMDLSQYNIHFLSAGGHKWLLAPIGTGFFYCNRNALELLDPPNVGYHTVGKGEAHTDYDLTYRPNAGRFEEALVNFPGIWGLDMAVRMQLAIGPAEIEKHIIELTAYAMERIRAKGWTVISPTEHTERSGLVSFGKSGINVEDVADKLTAAGVDLAPRAGSLRISPSYFNDRSDIDQLLQELPNY